MRIIVDAFGGDNSPEEIVKGTLDAIREREGFDVALVGKENAVRSLLQKETDYDASRVSVVNADDVITCEEAPVEAIRKKPNSSIVVAAKLLKEDSSAKAFVSAGSSGAVLAAAIFLTPRIKGIIRPALAPTMPNLQGGETMLLDCGANVDVKPMNLAQFALMGSIYMSEVKGVKNPRVGLLSNGTEEGKGNSLTKEAYEMLKDEKDVNFVGNMESRDLLTGEYDLVVCDGFSGNVLLKSTEGACLEMLKLLKRTFTKSFTNKIGALLLKKDIYEIKDFMDYNNYGSAVMLGVNKTIVKGHGSTKALSIFHSINLAYKIESNNLREKIAREIKENTL